MCRLSGGIFQGSDASGEVSHVLIATLRGELLEGDVEAEKVVPV